ncbi:MAG: DUF3368 domain-containing protein [Candidatus Thermoplasmatota archaeon]|nr:DUF3368 domain-containing protein [Candidatus Thermoplasmatota archaeon]
MQGIETKGIVWLIFEFLRNDVISKDESKDFIDSMIDEGWYCSTDLYKNMLQRVE